MMKKGRIVYYDYAKAVAMLFVLIFHFFGVDIIGETLTIVLYTLHVPTFFYVSGVFLQSGLEKYDIKHIVYNRFVGLILPFILWTFLLSSWKMSVDFLFEGSSNLLTVLLSSIHELWYFPCLYLAIVFLAIWKKMGIPRWICGGIVLVAFVAFAWYNKSIAKLAISIAIVWLGYMHRNFTMKKTAIIVTGYIFLLFVFLYWFHMDVTAEGMIGLPLLEIEGIKLLGCMVIPAIMWGISFLTDSFNREESIFAKIGGHTKSIYILHFFPLSLYKKIDIINGKQAIIGFGISLLIVFVLYFGCHINKRVERALFLNE